MSLLAIGCATAAHPPLAPRPVGGSLAEATAVSYAERFVRANGYVVRQDADPAQVSRESCCADGEEVELILARRAGTLLGAACAVMPGNAWTEGPGWSVVFCFDIRNKEYREAIPEFPKWVRHRGRVVVMDVDGMNPRMVHEDFSLRAKGSKPLPGMAVFEEMLRNEAE